MMNEVINDKVNEQKELEEMKARMGATACYSDEPPIDLLAKKK